ncbi:hypothetical protein SCLARK_00904 [Spiroplasma clarkii]|uniref:lipoprotein n=1 Tax=Spiroplasma clarkii TaxID=2139 RepID=UPI000B564D2E|nr:lipoprotein [Spiroplasma clarkii]ARU91513.1 hypothetical protein SCLARK_00904 [Spiroplasma clarkii]
MKRLLGLLGAISLTASATAGVVACSPTGESAEKITEALPGLMSQYSKALFISQQGTTKSKTHVSSDYIFANILGNQKFSDLGIEKLATSNELTGDDTLNRLSEKHLDVLNLTSNAELKGNVYLGGTLDLETEVDSTISSILSMAPTIIGLFANPANAANAISSITSLIDIESLLSGDLLEQVKTIASDENLTHLEAAFSNDVYKDMDFIDAMNSTMIGLANAIEQLVNQDKATIYDYKTVDEINKNFKLAIEGLGQNIYGLIDGTKAISFDISKDMLAVAEIIRFVRTLLVYLNTFTYEEMTGDLITIEEMTEKGKFQFKVLKTKWISKMSLVF